MNTAGNGIGQCPQKYGDLIRMPMQINGELNNLDVLPWGMKTRESCAPPQNEGDRRDLESVS